MAHPGEVISREHDSSGRLIANLTIVKGLYMQLNIPVLSVVFKYQRGHS